MPPLTGFSVLCARPLAFFTAEGPLLNRGVLLLGAHQLGNRPLLLATIWRPKLLERAFFVAVTKRRVHTTSSLSTRFLSSGSSLVRLGMHTIF
ncbi:hypothetical protein BDV39DRAFT_138127 [Aspergillus sergii]|uniref:Uncharacterized protein n=1 Tax=Aspergillus sergii TaxID=1034303 RepID=A0A5N6WRC2_9EURO|nr:hypothetical protein BDV39DRAFT_138127 [Aspergillus sergii]